MLGGDHDHRKRSRPAYGLVRLSAGLEQRLSHSNRLDLDPIIRFGLNEHDQPQLRLGLPLLRRTLDTVMVRVAVGNLYESRCRFPPSKRNGAALVVFCWWPSVRMKTRRGRPSQSQKASSTRWQKIDLTTRDPRSHDRYRLVAHYELHCGVEASTLDSSGEDRDCDACTERVWSSAGVVTRAAGVQRRRGVAGSASGPGHPPT
jgi:hypothetical protein